jgi:hypothetical protein
MPPHEGQRPDRPAKEGVTYIFFQLIFQIGEVDNRFR